ncbi:MAG: prepilin-type N-terminal cleavage/methylation domain-containing protein, partial [bacterium]|nr:prepilin-type N-terminal cleavage/methylation domain-containing protein [bacterium]
MRRQSHIAGFTLMELLVVLAIMGVASTMGMVTFSRMNSIWSETKGRTEMDRKAEDALNSMREDLAAVQSPGSTGAPLVGTAANAQDPRFWGVTFANDNIVIPVAGAQSVTYAIERTKDGANLVRKVGPLYGGKSMDQIVAKDVLQLRLEYAQFTELEIFTRFGATVETETRRKIERGRRIREVL